MTKRRFIAPLVALFLCIGLVSVGFAAWVITAGSEDTFSEGQFTVYKVENKSIKIKTDLGTDNSVNLGAATKTAANDWLKFTDGTPEDLTFSLVITIENWNDLKDGNATMTFDVGAVTLTATGFTNNNYLVLPAGTTITVSKSGETWSASSPSATGIEGANFDATAGTLTINYAFAWGTAFGGKNPINHYNESAYSESLASTAKTALEALYVLNTQTKAYSITVEANIL